MIKIILLLRYIQISKNCIMILHQIASYLLRLGYAENVFGICAVQMTEWRWKRLDLSILSLFFTNTEKITSYNYFLNPFQKKIYFPFFLLYKVYCIFNLRPMSLLIRCFLIFRKRLTFLWIINANNWMSLKLF